MTNYKDEQEMELEALTSIFEDTEFEKISDTEFNLKLVPYPAGEQENHVTATLHVTYTDTYPDEPPEWELIDMESLGEPKAEELKEKVQEVVDSSLGMAMVYMMAEALREYLQSNNVKALSMHEEMMLRAKAEGGGDDDEEGDDDDSEEGDRDEEEEWKGLADKTLCPESERCTVESFNAWKLKFDEELIATGVLKREAQKAKTGKMFFLEAQNAQKDAADSVSGKTTDTGGGTPLVYDASLFGEGDEDDLDDLSGEDDEESPEGKGSGKGGGY